MEKCLSFVTISPLNKLCFIMIFLIQDAIERRRSIFEVVSKTPKASGVFLSTKPVLFIYQRNNLLTDCSN